MVQHYLLVRFRGVGGREVCLAFPTMANDVDEAFEAGERLKKLMETYEDVKHLFDDEANPCTPDNLLALLSVWRRVSELDKSPGPVAAAIAFIATRYGAEVGYSVDEVPDDCVEVSPT